MGKGKKLAVADVTLVDETSAEDQAFLDENMTDQERAAQNGAQNEQGQGQEEFTSESNGQAEAAVEAVEPATEDTSNSPAVQKAKKEYLKKVLKHGADRGAGGKALVEFAKTVVEGAQERVLVPADGKALYESFKRGAEKTGTLAEAPGVVPDSDVAFGEASTKDNKNKSFDVQVSKLKRFIKFGNGFADDAGEILALGITTHVGMLRDNVENLKYKSTYAALGELVGEHMKDERKGQGMSEQEMFDFFLGREPKIKSGLDLLINALDTVKKALKGKQATDNSEGREPISSAYAEEAVDVLRNAINEVDPSGKTLSDIDAKAKKSEEKAIVQEFKATLRHPPSLINYVN